MDENGLPWELINQLSDVYAWTIDFTRIQKGDSFKIIYNERYIEDTILVGIKNIDAAYFKHNGEELFAEGGPSKKINGFLSFDFSIDFLKISLSSQYERISSEI